MRQVRHARLVLFSRFSPVFTLTSSASEPWLSPSMLLADTILTFEVWCDKDKMSRPNRARDGGRPSRDRGRAPTRLLGVAHSGWTAWRAGRPLRGLLPLSSRLDWPSLKEPEFTHACQVSICPGHLLPVCLFDLLLDRHSLLEVCTYYSYLEKVDQLRALRFACENCSFLQIATDADDSRHGRYKGTVLRSLASEYALVATGLCSRPPKVYERGFRHLHQIGHCNLPQP